MRRNFDFSDVNLIPRYGIVNSRNECNTSVVIGNNNFKLPVYPANMESVITKEIAHKLASNGYFYTMHRFLNIEQHYEFIKYMKEDNLLVSISIGVGYNWESFMTELVKDELIPDYITIDIAHGHCLEMKKMLLHLKRLKIKSFIIAGNISTSEAANDLASWGADGVKIGIAPGLVCTTAMATRFGSRGIQASTVKDICDNLDYNVTVVADGGIREHGDIAVALVMGANLVMAGGMFAGFQESLGEVMDSKNGRVKAYWGSASSGTKGKKNRIEGIVSTVPYKDRSILTEMDCIEESLQSAISYAGGNDLKAFNNVKYIVRD